MGSAGAAGHAAGATSSGGTSGHGGASGAFGSAGMTYGGAGAGGLSSGGNNAGGSSGSVATGGASAMGGTSSMGGGGHGGSVSGTAGAGGMPGKPTFDVTFFVVADTHADPVLEDDLLAQARAVNAVAANGSWPTQINGKDTGFKGGPIGKPRGVVFVGDLTGWGTAPTEIPTFKHYFEAGNSADSIQFKSFLGLGNHDIDSADRAPDTADQYRALEWGYLDARHKGPNAPVPVTSYDAGSHAYSVDFDRVHIVQLNRFSGDVQYGLPSALGFLASDLKAHASDGRPVFLFHHYGMDAFGTGTNPLWWTDADREAYRNTLKGYHVGGVIVGHSHAAFNYSWEGLRVFQVNNAKAEINTGNNDGNGSFAIVRVTESTLNVVTCRWLDTSGKYELIEPSFSGPSDAGAIQ